MHRTAGASDILRASALTLPVLVALHRALRLPVVALIVRLSLPSSATAAVVPTIWPGKAQFRYHLLEQMNSYHLSDCLAPGGAEGGAPVHRAKTCYKCQQEGHVRIYPSSS